MNKPIEFGDFYKLLFSVKDGNKKKEDELQWLLAEYEHAKDSSGPFDELGQIFCHIGVMELFEYTGVDDIKFISSLNNSVWDYLQKRMGLSLEEYLIKRMNMHASNHNLVDKLAAKWESPKEDLSNNLEGLAQYISEGIIEVIR